MSIKIVALSIALALGATVPGALGESAVSDHNALWQQNRQAAAEANIARETAKDKTTDAAATTKESATEAVKAPATE